MKVQINYWLILYALFICLGFYYNWWSNLENTTSIFFGAIIIYFLFGIPQYWIIAIDKKE